MEDSSIYQQMQDEMSRFEAEISGAEELLHVRPVIGAGTFGAVQAQLERVSLPPPPPPPPTLMPPFPPGMMQPRLMFPAMPPPPPPPSMMVPSQVQRVRPPQGGLDMFSSSVPSFVRAGLPGPQLMPPPQPVVLSAAPQLYKKPKLDQDNAGKDRIKEKKRPSPPPSPPSPPPSSASSAPFHTPSPSLATPAPAPVTPAPPTISGAPDTLHPKPKKEKKSRKVVRTAGGQTWEDVTLLDWADDDFRMFCGDLGNDVTDELLVRTFSKYTSFQKAKVVRDKRTNKSKGFGFVSFKDPGDFIKAMKEMDGRYVGSRPIKLRKSTWKARSLDVVRKKEKEKAALLSLLMSGNKS